MGARPFDQPFWQSNTTLTLPSYALLNAVMGYQWKVGERLLISPQLKLGNLANVNAWQQGRSSSGVIPSEPFTAYGSVKLAFH